MNNDGVSLTSIAHPKASLWTRIKFFFRSPKDINPEALETIEIEINGK